MEKIKSLEEKIISGQFDDHTIDFLNKNKPINTFEIVGRHYFNRYYLVPCMAKNVLNTKIGNDVYNLVLFKDFFKVTNSISVIWYDYDGNVLNW